jgi:hypothetical protein
MKERPILFSGPLVRALIAGTKTQTRRPVKGVDFRGAGGPGDPDWNDPSCWGWADEYGDEWALAAAPSVKAIPCPYGVPDDRLWVKEKFAPTRFPGKPLVGIHYAATADTEWDWVKELESGESYRFPSGAGEPDPQWPQGFTYSWRSPLFMPRWASRLTLEITDVRVQRLQEISEEDAKAEGVEPFFTLLPGIGRDQRLTTGERAADAEHRASFAVKWDEVYSDGPLWIANPWVWALTFKVVKA